MFLEKCENVLSIEETAYKAQNGSLLYLLPSVKRLHMLMAVSALRLQGIDLVFRIRE